MAWRAGLLAALLLLPGVAAHQAGFQVAQVFLGTLPEGAEETFGLAPPTGPMPQGMLVVANVIEYEGRADLAVELRLANATLQGWTVAPGAVTRSLAALTPAPGAYVLAVRNPGPGSARVGLYYDVACDCPAKPLPVAVPHGLLVFPVEALRGAHEAMVEEPPVHRLEVSIARFTAPGAATWPEGFAAVQRSPAGEARANHTLRWDAAAPERFYIVARSAATDLRQLDLGSPEAQNASTLVAPRAARVGDLAAPAPLPAPALALAVLGLAALARRGTRNG